MKNRFLYSVAVVLILVGMVLGASPMPVQAHYADYPQGMKLFVDMTNVTGVNTRVGCYVDFHSVPNRCYIVRSFRSDGSPYRFSHYNISATSYKWAGDSYGPTPARSR